MRCELSRVSILAAGNLALASVGNFLSHLTAILHIALTIGQVGVATVTIVYVLKQIKALRKPKK